MKNKTKSKKTEKPKTGKKTKQKNIVKKENTPKKKGKTPRIQTLKKIKIKTQKKQNGTVAQKMNSVWVDILLPDPKVRKWLVQAIGEHAICVLRNFDRELSDEDIAKKTELRASDVRVVLNRLHANGLASYNRSRDKNSGWYSYNWKLDQKHASELAFGVKQIDKPEEVKRSENEEKYYSIVDGIKIIYTFEQAVDNQFKCPKTGEPLKYLE
jgi:transcription initiation factor TFIIE subunit alpha